MTFMADTYTRAADWSSRGTRCRTIMPSYHDAVSSHNLTDIPPTNAEDSGDFDLDHYPDPWWASYT